MPSWNEFVNKYLRCLLSFQDRRMTSMTDCHCEKPLKL